MSMYNIIEQCDIYLKALGSFQQNYGDKPGLVDNSNVIDFPANKNNSISFKFKLKITGQTGNDDTENVEIMVPLKYLSYIWGTFEMLLINCEISLKLTWSKIIFQLLVLLQIKSQHLQY